MIDPSFYNTQYLNFNLDLAAGCNPYPMVYPVQSVPCTMIASAELEQLRAENEQLKRRITGLETPVLGDLAR